MFFVFKNMFCKTCHLTPKPTAIQNGFATSQGPTPGQVKSLTIIRVVRSGFPPKTNQKTNRFFFCAVRSFVRLLVRSKKFQILVRADAIHLVQKSSNFEPSSRFFGRLKILNSKRRRIEFKCYSLVLISCFL